MAHDTRVEFGFRFQDFMVLFHFLTPGAVNQLFMDELESRAMQKL